MRGLLEDKKLDSYVQDAIENGAATSAKGLRKVLEIQRDWILEKGAALTENFDYSYGELFLNIFQKADVQTLLWATTRGTSFRSAVVLSRFTARTRTRTTSPLTPASLPTSLTVSRRVPLRASPASSPTPLL